MAADGSSFPSRWSLLTILAAVLSKDLNADYSCKREQKKFPFTPLELIVLVKVGHFAFCGFKKTPR